MITKFLVASIIVLVMGALELHSSPEVKWQHAYPYPTASWMTAVAWGPPGFVATGREGEILFSADANDWKRISVPALSETWFEAACYDGFRYIAVGDRNSIVVSTNGQDWTVVNMATNGWLYSCAAGNAVVAAAGSDRTLLLSTDGIEWHKRTTPETFAALTFGNGIWVALTGGSTAYVSSNLEDWMPVRMETWFWGGPALSSICFGNGLFVTGGAWRPDEPNGVSYATDLRVSTNGLDWVSITGLNSGGEIRGLAFGGGQFVAALKGHFLRSEDGAYWEKFSAPDTGGEMAGIAASATGQFVAVGSNGAMLKSQNAASWEAISKGSRVNIQSITWAKGRFVAAGGSPHYLGGPVGTSAVLSSTNGRDWQAALTNLGEQLSGVAYGNRFWVVTGDDGQIFTSRNGRDWTDRSLPPTTHDLSQIVFGGGRFVAFASWRDLVYRSVNGKRWTAAPAPFASEISKVKYLSRRFVGVGGDHDGLIFISRNGVKWKKTTISGIGWLAGVAHGGRRFVAAGKSSSAVSLDGVTWNVYPVPRVVYDLQYVDGWFIGVGPNGMVISRDGMEWQVPVQQDAPGILSLISSGEGTLVGSYGATLYRGEVRDSDRSTVAPD